MIYSSDGGIFDTSLEWLFSNSKMPDLFVPVEQLPMPEQVPVPQDNWFFEEHQFFNDLMNKPKPEPAIETPAPAHGNEIASGLTDISAQSKDRIAPGYNIPISEVKNKIFNIAREEGVDPNVALKVFGSEGLSNYQSQIIDPKTGRKEESFGPFQLYTRGGLGNEFIQKTGLNPRDPNTLDAQIRFSMQEAKKQGWTPWHGAAKVGVSKWQGIRPGVSPTVTSSQYQMKTLPKGATLTQEDLAPEVGPPLQITPVTNNITSTRAAGQPIYQPDLATIMESQGSTRPIPYPTVPQHTAPSAAFGQTIKRASAFGGGTVPLPRPRPNEEPTDISSQNKRNMQDLSSEISNYVDPFNRATQVIEKRFASLRNLEEPTDLDDEIRTSQGDERRRRMRDVDTFNERFRGINELEEFLIEERNKVPPRPLHGIQGSIAI